MQILFKFRKLKESRVSTTKTQEIVNNEFEYHFFFHLVVNIMTHIK